MICPMLQLLLLLKSLDLEDRIVHGIREVVAASWRRSVPQSRDHPIGDEAAIVQPAIVQRFGAGSAELMVLMKRRVVMDIEARVVLDGRLISRDVDILRSTIGLPNI